MFSLFAFPSCKVRSFCSVHVMGSNIKNAYDTNFILVAVALCSVHVMGSNIKNAYDTNFILVAVVM